MRSAHCPRVLSKKEITVPQSPLLRAVRVPAVAWVDACAAALDETTPTARASSASWQRLAWADAAGALTDEWRQLIGEHLTADLVFQVVAQFRGLTYVTEVSLGREFTTSVLSRYSVQPDPAGGTRLTGADPEVEFAVAPGQASWPLVRRGLPPLEEFRAEPRQTPPDELADVSVTDDVAAGLASAVADGGRPFVQSAAADVLEAEAGVTLTTLQRPDGVAAVGLARTSWVLGSGGLQRVHAVDGRVAVTRVSPGEIGFEVIWQTLGALDVRSQLRRRAS